MKVRLWDTRANAVIAEADIDDPQEAMRFLYDEAEKADHDTGPLVGQLDELKVPL
jgi:hypothetical protein